MNASSPPVANRHLQTTLCKWNVRCSTWTRQRLGASLRGQRLYWEVRTWTTPSRVLSVPTPAGSGVEGFSAAAAAPFISAPGDSRALLAAPEPSCMLPHSLHAGHPRKQSQPAVEIQSLSTLDSLVRDACGVQCPQSWHLLHGQMCKSILTQGIWLEASGYPGKGGRICFLPCGALCCIAILLVSILHQIINLQLSGTWERKT